MGRRRSATPVVSFTRGTARARWTSDSGRHAVTLGPVTDPATWKANYARLLERLAADPNAPGTLAAGEYLVAELARDYLASAAVPPGQDGRVRRAMALLTAAHAAVPAADFGPVQLADWRDHLCRLRRADGQPRYAGTSVREYMGWVRRAYRWGVERGRLPADAWPALAAVRNPAAGQARAAAEVPPADDADVDAALPHLTPPVAAMVRLQRLTGMRPGELFALTPAQVLRGGTHRLPGAGAVDLDAEGVWVYLPEAHKSKAKGKPRWVPLGPQARAVLAPYLDRGPSVPCFSPKESKAVGIAARAAARKTPRYPSHLRRNAARRKADPQRAAGLRYTRQSYRQAIHRACDKSGVPPWNPYQLRHRRAEEVDAEMGLDAARHALGHAGAQVTTRYAKVSFATAAKVAREMG